LLRDHIVDPLIGFLLAFTGLFLIDLADGPSDIRCHAAGIAADVDGCAILNQLPDLRFVFTYPVLYVGPGLIWQTRKCGIQAGNPLIGKILQLLFIEEVLLWMAAAKE
jgi:hypothetical protein